MSKQCDFTSYKDFLLNDDFINWRLLKDESLDNYWEDFIKNNPEHYDDFQKAIEYFQKIKLNDEKLDDAEFAILLNKIKSSSIQIKKKRKIRYAIQYAAACAAILIGITFFFLTNETKNVSENLISDNVIIGENLNSQDIYLITASGETSFANDVNIQIDDKGSLTVTEMNSDKSTSVQVAAKDVVNKLIVPYGKRSQIELSDGSKVWLNSGSVLEFPTNFSGKERNINLSGEMYIEVAKNDKVPFYVNTSNFQVKVYGTKFNISNYDDAGIQSVVLVEGKVSVKTASNAEEFLAPNEMAVLSNNEFYKEQIDVINYISWIHGYLLFDQTAISEVLKSLERYYNLKFHLSNNLDLNSRSCTGKLFLSNNLDNVMTTVSLLSSTEYTRDEENNIYINLSEK